MSWQGSGLAVGWSKYQLSIPRLIKRNGMTYAIFRTGTREVILAGSVVFEGPARK
jgi:hypothetical protein